MNNLKKILLVVSIVINFCFLVYLLAPKSFYNFPDLKNDLTQIQDKLEVGDFISAKSNLLIFDTKIKERNISKLPDEYYTVLFEFTNREIEKNIEETKKSFNHIVLLTQTKHPMAENYKKLVFDRLQIMSMLDRETGGKHAYKISTLQAKFNRL